MIVPKAKLMPVCNWKRTRDYLKSMAQVTLVEHKQRVQNLAQEILIVTIVTSRVVRTPVK